MSRFEGYMDPNDSCFAFTDHESSENRADDPRSDDQNVSPSKRRSSNGSRQSGPSNSTLLFRYRVVPSVGFVHVSGAMVRATGRTAQEFHSKPELLSQLTSPADQPGLVAMLNSATSDKDPVVVRVRTSRGTTIPVNLTHRRIHNEDGDIVAVEVVGRRARTSRNTDQPDNESDERLSAAMQLCREALGVLRPVRSDTGEVVDFDWFFVNEPLETMLGAGPKTLIGSTLTESAGALAEALIPCLADWISAPDAETTTRTRRIGSDLTARAILRGESVIVQLERDPPTTSRAFIDAIRDTIEATLDQNRTLKERLAILCDALLELGADFSLVLLRQVTNDAPLAVYRTQPGFADQSTLARSIERWIEPSASVSGLSTTGEPNPEVEVLASPNEESAEQQGTDTLLDEIQLFEPSSVYVSPLRGAEDELGMILFGTDHDSLPLDEDRIQIAQLVTRPITFLLENGELRDEVRSASLVREEFMSMVAHEIKTPLTGIQGYGQLLDRFLSRNEPDLYRARRAVGGLQTQIQRFRTLANDLLDATRVHEGRLDLRLEQSSLQAIVQSAVDRVQALEPAAERQIVVDIGQPILGIWDAARIDQVLYILLSNAVNYSAEGEIRLSARQEDDVAAISVVDQGVGIRQDDIRLLFEPFGRGRRAHGLSSGSGLGLYLAREIVRRHGGQISLRSQVDVGTTVTLRLPLNSPESGSQAHA